MYDPFGAVRGKFKFRDVMQRAQILAAEIRSKLECEHTSDEEQCLN